MTGLSRALTDRGTKPRFRVIAPPWLRSRKGHIERLPSGSFRVHVYAGTDPVTGKERRLKRTVATEERTARELARLTAM